MWRHSTGDVSSVVYSEYEISYEQSVTVEIHISLLDIICDPPVPKHTEDNKFSYQYISAAVMREKDLKPDTFGNEKITDSKFA